MRKIFYIFAVLSFFATATCYGQGNNCLRLYCDPTICYNPDSVMVDTCDSSPTYEKKYCKFGFDVEFIDNVMNVGYGTSDSILEVTWESIDVSYSNLRDAFRDLYASGGAYVFRKIYPSDTSSSSTSSRHYRLRFLDYSLVDSILVNVNKIERIYWSFNAPAIPNSTPSERDGLYNLSQTLRILPNPTNNYITLISSDKTISGQVSICIFDQRGVVVASESIDISSENKINVSSLASGVYQVYCDDAKVGSLVIQR